jgi:hypothetical protein
MHGILQRNDNNHQHQIDTLIERQRVLQDGNRRQDAPYTLHERLSWT